MNRAVLALAFFVSACACTQPAEKPWDAVPPAPKLPEGDGLDTPLGAACAHLRELGCPEGEARTRNGKTRTCYQTMLLAQDSTKATVPVECVRGAPTREAVRECGDRNRDITFRCLAP